MDAVLVWEDGEGLEAAIRRGWRRWSGRELPEGDSKDPTLAVISPAASRRWELERDLPLVCGVVLLPGEAGDLLTGRLADSAVSYGVSGRDTLTVSSRGEGRLLAALQREVDTARTRNGPWRRRAPCCCWACRQSGWRTSLQRQMKQTQSRKDTIKSHDKEGEIRRGSPLCACVFGRAQTLKRKRMMSPSCTTYSLPSERMRPFSRAAAMLPTAMRSS